MSDLISFQKTMETCKKTIELFGIDSQFGMIIEECAELIHAINKYKRGRISIDELKSEFADVEIMLIQFSLIFDWKEIKNKKIERLTKIIQDIENETNPT